MLIKALSIRQPWAWLIVEGHKDVENRTWATSFRGRFFVHASKTFDDAAYLALCRERSELRLPAKSQFHLGGIVGAASLVDCVVHHDSVWFTGPYGFVLVDPERLEFVPGRGALKFFTVGFMR